MTSLRVARLFKMTMYVSTRLCAAVRSVLLMESFAEPTEMSLLLTYSMACASYLGVMAKAAMQNAATPPTAAVSAMIHALRHSSRRSCKRSIS